MYNSCSSTLAHTIRWKLTKISSNRKKKGITMHLILFRFVFDSTAVRCRITVEWESNGVESRSDRSCNQHLIAAKRQQLRGRCRWVASDGSHKTRSRDVGDYSDRYRNFIRRELLPYGVVSRLLQVSNPVPSASMRVSPESSQRTTGES